MIHFLNDIFGRTTNPIEDVTFLKTAQEPEIAAQGVSAVDVLCEDTQRNRFIVEMQLADEPGFEKRAQYYAARTYIDQRDRGIEYQDLKEVIFLVITGFTLFPDKPDYLCHHAILDLKTQERDLKDFFFSFLELPKFKKTKEQLRTPTEKWSYFFKHAKETTNDDLPLVIGGDGIIGRAYQELERFNWSQEELRAYDSMDMKRSSEKAILEGAKEKGIREGLQQGKMEVAKQLRNMGMELGAIAQRGFRKKC